MTVPSLGVCYYPEHWPGAQWAEDAARMAKLGVTHVRVGEFAWPSGSARAVGRQRVLYERVKVERQSQIAAPHIVAF